MYSVDDIIENLDRNSNVGDSEEDEDIEEAEEVNEPGDGNNTEGKDEKSEQDDTSKTPKKPRVKRDIPKLDAQRLRGPRGLTALEKMFENVKFKGNGYEKQDLDKIMVTLHHWCHRLFPKYTFDDCLAQLEKLGSNKSVMTLKKSIRMGILDDVEVQKDDEIIDEPEPQPVEINEFDALLEQEAHMPVNIISKDPSPVKEVLTDEQKEIIERNRMLAAEKRRARLEAQKKLGNSSETLSQIDFTQSGSSQNPEPTQNSQNVISLEDDTQNMQNPAGEVTNLTQTKETTIDVESSQNHKADENRKMKTKNEVHQNQVETRVRISPEEKSVVLQSNSTEKSSQSEENRIKTDKQNELTEAEKCTSKIDESSSKSPSSNITLANEEMKVQEKASLQQSEKMYSVDDILENLERDSNFGDSDEDMEEDGEKNNQRKVSGQNKEQTMAESEGTSSLVPNDNVPIENEENCATILSETENLTCVFQSKTAEKMDVDS